MKARHILLPLAIIAAVTVTLTTPANATGLVPSGERVHRRRPATADRRCVAPTIGIRPAELGEAQVTTRRHCESPSRTDD